MSKRHTPRDLRTVVCPFGKVQFDSAEVAGVALNSCLKRGSGEIRYYECNECHKFHLTSKPDMFAGLTKYPEAERMDS